MVRSGTRQGSPATWGAKVAERRDHQTVDEPDRVARTAAQSLPDELEVKRRVQCIMVEQPRQRGAEASRRVVGHQQRELPPCGGRVERSARREEPLGGSAHSLDLPGQLRGERRQDVGAPDPDEQLVREMPAQPGQRGADGRLGDAEVPDGTGDVSLAQQCTERDRRLRSRLARCAGRDCRGVMRSGSCRIHITKAGRDSVGRKTRVVHRTSPPRDGVPRRRPPCEHATPGCPTGAQADITRSTSAAAASSAKMAGAAISKSFART